MFDQNGWFYIPLCSFLFNKLVTNVFTSLIVPLCTANLMFVVFLASTFRFLCTPKNLTNSKKRWIRVMTSSRHLRKKWIRLVLTVFILAVTFFCGVFFFVEATACQTVHCFVALISLRLISKLCTFNWKVSLALCACSSFIVKKLNCSISQNICKQALFRQGQ